MTPLSDALTAAQRSALAALEKGYVAGQIDADGLRQKLESVGISDPVDVAFLIAALDVLREWGVSAPTMTERVADANEPATEKQMTYMNKLLYEKHVADEEYPDGPLTKEQASEIIDSLQNGTYDPAKWRVPF